MDSGFQATTNLIFDDEHGNHPRIKWAQNRLKAGIKGVKLEEWLLAAQEENLTETVTAITSYQEYLEEIIAETSDHFLIANKFRVPKKIGMKFEKQTVIDIQKMYQTEDFKPSRLVTHEMRQTLTLVMCYIHVVLFALPAISYTKA